MEKDGGHEIARKRRMTRGREEEFESEGLTAGWYS